MAVVTILGVDLAWGEKNDDAFACLQLVDGVWSFGAGGLCHGDAALLAEAERYEGRVILALDAPVLCVNETGSRPVDKECNQHFRRYEAGCHPVNLGLCPRPIRLASLLENAGFAKHWELARSKRVQIEVYPHPAMIRLFDLTKTLKYKRGRKTEKSAAFQVYQTHFSNFLKREMPEVSVGETLAELLHQPWTKKTEDLLDAYFCAVIGYWHFTERTEVLGDCETGFMVVPQASSP